LSELRTTADHVSAWRDVVVYDTPAPPSDPESTGVDATTNWATILLLLLLVPPLGLLQLSRRHDVDLRLRLYIAAVALLLLTVAWGQGLGLLPTS
jgi:hypothetical protein